MIYPVHDHMGKRIGTIISEDSDDPDQRWIAYAGQERRRGFPTWQTARAWIEDEAARRDAG